MSPERQGDTRLPATGNNTNSTDRSVAGMLWFAILYRDRLLSPKQVCGADELQCWPTVAQDLFGEGNDPVGKTIRVNRINFKVIGVLQAKAVQG